MPKAWGCQCLSLAAASGRPEGRSGGRLMLADPVQPQNHVPQCLDRLIAVFSTDVLRKKLHSESFNQGPCVVLNVLGIVVQNSGIGIVWGEWKAFPHPT